MRIFKYLLEVKDIQQIELPVGSKILSVQVQKGSPHIWVLVPIVFSITYFQNIYTIETGDEIPSDYIERFVFLGTYQLLEGNFVGHVFYPGNQ